MKLLPLSNDFDNDALQSQQQLADREEAKKE